MYKNKGVIYIAWTGWVPAGVGGRARVNKNKTLQAMRTFLSGCDEFTLTLLNLCLLLIINDRLYYFQRANSLHKTRTYMFPRINCTNQS